MPKTKDLLEGQGHGVAPTEIRDLDEACAAWRKWIAKRQDILKKEVEAKAAVVELMKKHNVEIYPYRVDDDTVMDLVLEGKETLKLKRQESGDDDNSGD